MTIIYNHSGDPTASIEGNALFSKHGQQMGFLEESTIFDNDGIPAGTYINGLVRDGDGRIHGFSKHAKSGPAPLMARLGMLPPRVASVGQDIQSLPQVPIPSFLVGKLQNPSEFRIWQGKTQ
jgi:hypothetical protein